MVSASAPSVYSVQALSLLAEVRWTFCASPLNRNHLCTCHFYRQSNYQLKLLKTKVIFFFSGIILKNEKITLFEFCEIQYLLTPLQKCLLPISVGLFFFNFFLRFWLLSWTWFIVVMRKRKLCHWSHVCSIMCFRIYAITGKSTCCSSYFLLYHVKITSDLWGMLQASFYSFPPWHF